MTLEQQIQELMELIASIERRDTEVAIGMTYMLPVLYACAESLDMYRREPQAWCES